MATKAVETTPSTEVEQWNPDEFPDHTVEEDRPSFLNANAKKGKFIASDDASERDEVEIVLLAEKPGRAYFPNKYDAQNPEPPACRSNDGIHGVGNPGNDEVQAVPNANDTWLCATCPNSVWGEDKQPPDCSELKILLVADTEFQSPAVMQLKSRSLGCWNKFKKGLDKTRKVSGRPSYAYVIRCAWEVDGDFFLPVFEIARDLSLDEAKPYAEAVKALIKGFYDQGPEFDTDGEGKKAEAPASDFGDDSPF